MLHIAWKKIVTLVSHCSQIIYFSNLYVLYNFTNLNLPKQARGGFPKEPPSTSSKITSAVW